MPRHADILDLEEPLGKSFLTALALHLALAGAVIGVGLLKPKQTDVFGDPNGGGVGSVSVTAVARIPLPSRGGPTNPVANETESQVPEPPAKSKPTPRAPAEDPDAIEISGKRSTKKPSPVASAQNKWRAQQHYADNQLYSDEGQALSSPRIGMSGGGGTVGLGNNSPFGNRFGYYANLLRQRVGEKWNTSAVDPRVQQAPRVIVQFTILKDGSVPAGSVRIVERSGISALDYSAQRAIFDASPLPPLPAGFEKNEALIELTFDLSTRR